jgi:hypothetical protein
VRDKHTLDRDKNTYFRCYTPSLLGREAYPTWSKHMTQDQLVQMLGSSALVLTIVSVLRKIFPSINGRNVYILALITSILSTYGSIYVTDMPKWAYSLVVSVVVAFVTVGSATFVQGLVDRHAEKTKVS